MEKRTKSDIFTVIFAILTFAVVLTCLNNHTQFLSPTLASVSNWVGLVDIWYLAVTLIIMGPGLFIILYAMCVDRKQIIDTLYHAGNMPLTWNILASTILTWIQVISLISTPIYGWIGTTVVCTYALGDLSMIMWILYVSHQNKKNVTQE